MLQEKSAILRGRADGAQLNLSTDEAGLIAVTERQDESVLASLSLISSKSFEAARMRSFQSSHSLTGIALRHPRAPHIINLGPAHQAQ